MGGFQISGVDWDTFMKMAGYLHWAKNVRSTPTTNDEDNAVIRHIYFTGDQFGEALWYGEIEYAGRMIWMGWQRGKQK